MPISRAKAGLLGVPATRVFEAMQVYLGSAYLNDFSLHGRAVRVTVQADAPFRDDASDIAQLKARSQSAIAASGRASLQVCASSLRSVGI